jgi:hypothetical protein
MRRHCRTPHEGCARACGQAVRLRGPAQATWQLRLLVERDPRALSRASMPHPVRRAPRRLEGVRRFRALAGMEVVAHPRGTHDVLVALCRGEVGRQGAPCRGGPCTGCWPKASFVRWAGTARWRSFAWVRQFRHQR